MRQRTPRSIPLSGRTSSFYGWGLLLGLGWILSTQLLGDPEERHYDVPEGRAIDTLLIIAEKSDTAILFSEKTVKDVRTQAVRSFLTLDRALGIMLEGTPLEAVPVSNGRAYAILPRAEKGGKVPERSENELKPKENTKTQMNLRKSKKEQKSNGLIKGLLAFAVAFAPNLDAQEEGKDTDEVYELSPFTVSAKDQDGYRATSTLAGSRTRTDLRELGSSISVVTKEFLDDTGATDGESLLSYVGNVEVAGVLGNFSDVNTDNQSTNAARNNPQNAQRIRGLVSAVLTSDYFQTNIPFDSYNTSRVTVNRGPNSILFGLGSPGGVINNSTSKAQIGSDFGSFSFRFDKNGGHRATFDYNRTIIEDRLSLRLSALNENIKYKQDPAFEDDTRLFVAWDAVLARNEHSDILGKTKFRGSFEDGEIFRNPPDIVPPTDYYSSWFEGYGDINGLLQVPGIGLGDLLNEGVTQQQVRDAVNAGLATVPDGMSLDEFAESEGKFIPKTSYDRFNQNGRENVVMRPLLYLFPAVNFNSPSGDQEAGWTDPGLAGVQGIMGRWRRDGFITQENQWTFDPYETLPGFYSRSVSDRNIFDYHNYLFQGTSNKVETDFDINRLFLEQELFGGNGGIELAFDRQSREQEAYNVMSSGRNKAISIDITSHQAPGDENFDGIADRLPNENFGRPIVATSDNDTTWSRNEQDTFRATVFATLDFSDYLGERTGNLLGSHTVTGLFESRKNDQTSTLTRGVWWADSGGFPGATYISNGDNDNFRRAVRSQIYLGPDTSGLSSADQLRISGPIMTQLPQVGDEFGIWYFDNRGDVDSGVINQWSIIDSLQSANISRTELDSEAISLQSRFLGGHLVGMYAVRNDKQKAYQRLQETSPRSETGGMGLRLDDPGINPTDGNFNSALLKLEDSPATVDENDTETWSLVAKYPETLLGNLPFGMDISAHYYEAESFQPAGISNNILNQPVSSPYGETKEYGTTLEFFEQRLSLRLNWYETINASARTNLGGNLGLVVGEIGHFLRKITQAENGGVPLFPSDEDAQLVVPDNTARLTGTDADLLGVNTYDEYYDTIIGLLPSEVQDIYNFRVTTAEDGTRIVDQDPIRGLTSTFDFVAKGFEADLVGRITKNWSVALNVAQQETVQSNTGPVAVPLAYEIEENLVTSGLALLRDEPFAVAPVTYGQRYSNTTRTMRVERAKDNTVSQEQREWRINLISRYDFNEGIFEGFGIGGALRYQDEVSVGYPNKMDSTGLVVPDIENPWFGPDELNGDLFVRYKRNLSNKMDWTVQLNARNLYRSNGNRDIPVTINPDGGVAIIRIPNEQQYFLTNTFSF